MASKDLRRAIQGLGLYITGKEAKKVSSEFDVNPLLIASLASKYATENKETVSFSAKLASQLRKLADKSLPSITSASLTGGGSGVLSAMQTSQILEQLGISPEFARNIASTPKFDKGQMLTIGQKGVGSVMPLDRSQGAVPGAKRGKGEGNRNRSQETVTPGYDYAAELAAMGGLGGLGGGGGGISINLGGSDTDYMNQLQRQSNQIRREMNRAIETLTSQANAPTAAAASTPSEFPVYSAGNNYNVTGIRAADRTLRRRTDYLRDMAISPSISTSLISQPVGGISI